MSYSTLRERLLNTSVYPNSDLYNELHKEKEKNERKLVDLNASYFTNEEIVQFLIEITGETIDHSVTISQPFYSDFGKHITLGKHIFINKNVTFIDLGGITIEDHVLIGPGVSLLTVNHLTELKQRRGLALSPIVVKENAWIGANATILPGVTVGKNAVIAAGSVVTKDVQENVTVAGCPAKVIRTVES